MKLSFSTLGCPDWKLSDIISTAADLGYNGIEIRGIGEHIYTPNLSVFSGEELKSTQKALEKVNLEVPIVTSGAYLCNNKNISDAEKEVIDYLSLASRLNAGYVRVLGEKDPAPDLTQDIETALTYYAKLCDIAAKDYGRDLLIETNGYFANTVNLSAFLERVDRPNMGVIWDINHTVRYFDEAPSDTVKRIGKYIKHVHVKDSVIDNNKAITYMLTGYGTLPIKEAFCELSGAGYEGFWSYEWVKRWARELAEPGVAFYRYIEYMRGLK